jgi:hypothetical protein
MTTLVAKAKGTLCVILGRKQQQVAVCIPFLVLLPKL